MLKPFRYDASMQHSEKTAIEVGIGKEVSLNKVSECTIRPKKYLHEGGNCIAKCSLWTTVTLKHI